MPELNPLNSNTEQIFGALAAKELYKQGLECYQLHNLLKSIDALHPKDDPAPIISAGLIVLSQIGIAFKTSAMNAAKNNAADDVVNY